QVHVRRVPYRTPQFCYSFRHCLLVRTLLEAISRNRIGKRKGRTTSGVKPTRVPRTGQMTHFSPTYLAGIVLTLAVVMSAPHLNAQNQVLGELQLQGATDAEKTAGVWVDGQYLGYLKELKGTKKILLLPGEHQITVRQAGYIDFTSKVVLQPGEKQLL